MLMIYVPPPSPDTPSPPNPTMPGKSWSWNPPMPTWPPPISSNGISYNDDVSYDDASSSSTFANFDAIYECDTDPQCKNKVRCKVPLIPVCRNHKCICDPHLGPRKTWSTRSKRVQGFPI
ncbi:hypothetical protein P8452_48006 [Trifolium repens]|nr:hypothetical protein P8452_48006 [Trifolium repens]